jgi:hypothetical protein
MSFLTILASSERYHTVHRRRHKNRLILLQVILQGRRCVPKREMYSSLDTVLRRSI